MPAPNIVHLEQLCSDPQLTFTHVETTANLAATDHTNAVHPHVRGDNPDTKLLREIIAGSPPRAWGQSAHERQKRTYRRFTPTCVGTTHASIGVQGMYAVHPHVRGDNVYGYFAIPALHGSPPRAWGQPALRDRFRFRSRFTPTCVGTTVTHPPIGCI